MLSPRRHLNYLLPPRQFVSNTTLALFVSTTQTRHLHCLFLPRHWLCLWCFHHDTCIVCFHHADTTLALFVSTTTLACLFLPRHRSRAKNRELFCGDDAQCVFFVSWCQNYFCWPDKLVSAVSNINLFKIITISIVAKLHCHQQAQWSRLFRHPPRY